MNRRQLAIIVFGPVPIVVASLAISSWLRTSGPNVVSPNQVWAADDSELGSMSPMQRFDETKSSSAYAVQRLESYLEDRCGDVAVQLRPALGPECSVIVRPPLVIAGDLPEAELENWHRNTIAPAARALASRYFTKSPTLPVTILLFASDTSYDRYAKHLFNEEGISVYGYYKPDRRTLVMNIATGGGTLVHELTHALIDFDFPQIPDWFNEGFASLHEQCRFLPDDGGLEGLPNWRLPGLQDAVRQGRLPSLETMMASDDFRGRDVGLNYAQARYFCLYLQRRGLLEEFYRRFRAAHPQDPNGAATARSVFGEAAWKSVDRDFQAWVLTLTL